MTNQLPLHTSIDGYTLVDDCLQFAGIPLPRLAARVGQTPFYAYSRALMSERVAKLRRELPPELHLHYAMKANPMPAVVQHLAGLVDGLDVASGRELSVALDTGIAPQTISFAGPGKSAAELRQAVAAGIVINLESPRELEQLVAISQTLGLRPQIAVRVNPDFELKTSGMKMSGGPKQFGIDAEQVPALLQHMANLPVDFVGLHIFSGSQNLRPDAIVEAQTNSLELAYRLAESAPAPIKILNIGGGFGIPYFPGDKPLQLDSIAANLQAQFPKLQARLPQAQLVIELGRYLVGEAGIYVCQVLDRKRSRGQVFLVTNGGLHHHLAASGNFGQVLRKNYPVLIGNKIHGQTQEIASVVGPLCTPLDLLADKMPLAVAEPGDYVVVFQSGAYGLSASPGGFLSHPEAVEVLVG